MDKYITVGEAAKMLGVSRVKMSALIKNGVIKAESDILDLRIKLILCTDIEKLMELPGYNRERKHKNEGF